MLFPKRYLKRYFRHLYIEKRLDVLDEYLDRDYFDQDIGPGVTDHLANSKKFVSALLERHPGIRVEVKRTTSFGNILCARLDWIVPREKAWIVWQKGLAVFVLKNKRIVRRSTVIYYQNDAAVKS